MPAAYPHRLVDARSGSPDIFEANLEETGVLQAAYPHRLVEKSNIQETSVQICLYSGMAVQVRIPIGALDSVADLRGGDVARDGKIQDW